MVNNLMIGIFNKSTEERLKLETKIMASNDPLTMYSYAKTIKKGIDIKPLEDIFLSLENNDYIYYWAYDIENANIYRCINIMHNKKQEEYLIDNLVEKYLLSNNQTLLNKESVKKLNK